MRCATCNQLVGLWSQVHHAKATDSRPCPGSWKGALVEVIAPTSPSVASSMKLSASFPTAEQALQRMFGRR